MENEKFIKTFQRTKLTDKSVITGVIFFLGTFISTVFFVVTIKDLNEDIYYTLGRGYATFLHQRRIKETTVGRDNRLSSEVYTKALIAGLNDGGIDTIDLGLSMSQIAMFAKISEEQVKTILESSSH